MKLATTESLRVTDEKKDSSRYLLIKPLEDGLTFQVSSDGLGVFFTFFTELAGKEDVLGRMLFDDVDNWVYEGRGMSVSEQEDLAFQILHYNDIKTTDTKLSISDFYERHL
jgi:hypothetical protein